MLITSVNESSSLPTFDVPLINLATLPSKVSRIAANPTAIIAIVQFASNANFIELKPRQPPKIVNAFGKRDFGFFLRLI